MKEKDVKNFGNVMHLPTVCDDQDNNTPVKCHLPPPELHLLIDLVTKIYSALEAIWSQSMNWLQACNIKKGEYHGRSFAGNDSRKLLQNVDSLEPLKPPSSRGKYVSAFNSFNEVVSSFYGTELHPEFQYKIAIFAKDYMKLGITMTPKVHAVMFHVAKFYLMMGWGLGPWRGQERDSVRYDFKETWQKYKVNDIDRTIYRENLLKARSVYNSQHI